MPRYALAADVQDIAALYHLVWHETQAPFKVVVGPGREVSVPFWRMIKALRDSSS